MYQPKIADEHIQQLYQWAKRLEIPMTRLVNRLLEHGIARLAQGAERQEFVTQHRTILLELLAVQEKQEGPVQPLSSDVQPDTQPGLILTALRTATKPLWQDELAQVPGVNRRVLGRNLTRLCDTGRVEKTTDGRYVAHGE